jgi:putative phosphoribosyl transferase
MTTRLSSRRQAGELLAARLVAYAQRPDTVVLALPRGGVPVGYALAERLQLPLDVLGVRKLGVPGHEEFAMGAVASGGLRLLDEDVVVLAGIHSDAIDAASRREGVELARRERLYRDGREPLEMDGRVAILVDDGLMTGASMHVAIRAVRLHDPLRVIVAVPIAAPETSAEVLGEVDSVVCLGTPEPMRSVGEWYEDFPAVSDAEVASLLARAARRHPLPARGVPSAVLRNAHGSSR